MTGSPAKVLHSLRRNPRVWFGLGVIVITVITALGANVFAPFAADHSDITLRMTPPNSLHWLGCDLEGRDVFTSLLYGARVSLYIAFVTVMINLTLGLGVGLLSGYKLGWVDTVLMRSVDIALAIPQILVALVLASLLGGSINNIVLAIAATGWAASARIARGQVLALREREYVQASRALGAKDGRLAFIHILPGILTPLVVHGTFSLAGVIIVESTLSFLGLGAQEGSPTWGALLGQGRRVLVEAPHLSIAPGVAIMLIVLAINFLGDALRDALDPRHT